MNNSDSKISNWRTAAILAVAAGLMAIMWAADVPPTQTETENLGTVTRTWFLEDVHWKLSSDESEYAKKLRTVEVPVISVPGIPAVPRFREFTLAQVQSWPTYRESDLATNRLRVLLLARFAQAENTATALTNAFRVMSVPGNAWMLVPTNAVPQE